MVTLGPVILCIMKIQAEHLPCVQSKALHPAELTLNILMHRIFKKHTHRKTLKPHFFHPRQILGSVFLPV